ncbi:uncharacterized protein LOC116248921 isoform X2 [Nymphaea colorata]|uniref:uncharacterized protein LOC116248921 isoform X2 n=1 Tax=Nymphaea colorata TaxID=210225 RepID=UPI00129EFD65|nr:uncharacterized protein LOC116248921 isoform X2 [Nymphaea colorata]
MSKCSLIEHEKPWFLSSRRFVRRASFLVVLKPEFLSLSLSHFFPALLTYNHAISLRFFLLEGRRSSVQGSNTSDSGTNNLGESVESAYDFTQRIFGGFGDSTSETDPFYQKLDRLEKARGRAGFGSRRNNGYSSGFQNTDDMETFDTLSDGMDGKLKKAAMSYPYSDEIKNDDYAFRPDVNFRQGVTYTVKDLDLTKPGVQKRAPREEFETTTEEVLRKADFRNVRFLSNFITEAGIIIKRSKTGISAKAQRRVAREIKTARAFGLMPFTTMGTKPFVFGKSVEDLDEDYDFEYFGGNFVAGSGKGEAAT